MKINKYLCLVLKTLNTASLIPCPDSEECKDINVLNVTTKKLPGDKFSTQDPSW